MGWDFGDPSGTGHQGHFSGGIRSVVPDTFRIGAKRFARESFT